MMHSASSVIAESTNPNDLLPKPRTIEQTGIPSRLLESLLLKHLSQAIDLDIPHLSRSMALPGNLIDILAQKLKAEALVEVRSDLRIDKGIRYALTKKGMLFAQHELQRDGYLGPTPIPLSLYKEIVTSQSLNKESVTPKSLKEGLSDLILPEKLVGQLGPALNSGRAIFIYGLPGTGKTYVSRRLVRMFNSNVFIPHSVCIGHQILQVYDPIIHKKVNSTPIKSAITSAQSLRLDDGHDERLLLCKRPEVVVGGELTDKMFEVSYDIAHKINRAPLQMKANNGIFLIDDLGRQRVSVDTILNRWIVPLEEKIDYLSMASGEHFDIPFEQVLVFSSNIHPAKLADDAFLRRIGYKIEFEPISISDYQYLWQQQGLFHDLSIPSESLKHVIDTLHKNHNIPLLPCYPRDLVTMCRNQIDFFQLEKHITPSLIDSVWSSYFVDRAEHDVLGGTHG
ncbi:MAG: AAA family ATPase [Photobacterium frigidiphilum]|uniref:AAA family ATPase n=1 Tax=Photobacterium frigidiphilum TaxID=264736 RepID=UPI003002841E